MKRKDHANFLFSGALEDRFERARVAQLDIDVFCARQKSQKQFTSFRQRQISKSAFARIARGDDYRCSQRVDLAFGLFENIGQTIEAKLEKIRRRAQRERATQVGRRSDHADEQGFRLHPTTARQADYFDRSSPCHILNGSNNYGMTDPL